MKNLLFLFGLLLASGTQGELCNDCSLGCPKTVCDRLDNCTWDLDSNKCLELTHGSGYSSGDISGSHESGTPSHNTSSSTKTTINFILFITFLKICYI